MKPRERIDGLRPVGAGHALVFYGDACSGVPGGPHEATLAATNDAIQRLDPQPDFLIFAGDEIVGLTGDEADLRAQWRHWLDVEMSWLDRTAIPLYHTTSNHTTYNVMSERVFAEVLDHLPRNGPPTQQGLAYHVRRDDLLVVFVNTCATDLGGEGMVETAWLDSVLTEHHDATTKLVVGHHPIHPVNGLAGDRQREVAAETGRRFWDVLVSHGVVAYLCSHILAFDVQVHRGVLQVLSAGAGTIHRMPPETEYLHFVNLAVDDRGLRYRVIDQSGRTRERLAWPPRLPPSADWIELDDRTPLPADGALALRVRGVASAVGDTGAPQTLLAVPGQDPTVDLAPLWVGLTGPSLTLTATVTSGPGRSPHYWFGPNLEPGEPFDLQLLLHRDMGPGGLLYRDADSGTWSSLRAASPWGLEVLPPVTRWLVGRTEHGSPFRGRNLRVSAGLEEISRKNP